MAMNQSASSAQSQAGKAFHAELAKVFLQNELAATTTQRIAAAATAAGAVGVDGIASVGAHGSHPGNAHRDLLRRLRRASPWPKVYRAKVPCQRDGVRSQEDHPFLLPHEIVHAIGLTGSSLGFVEQGDQPAVARHVEKFVRDFNITLPCMPVGLHGDGVPYGSDEDSFEVFSLNLVYQVDQPALRIPLTAVQKKFLVKGDTHRAIMEVLTWSFRMLALELHPTLRHDRSPWRGDDGARKAAAGSPLSASACLVQVRGDWCFFNQVFGFPQWNTKAGCCWLCSIILESLREVGVDASWRQGRFTGQEFMAKLRERHGKVSPLFSVPGLTLSCFKPDWLHAMDLGIGADAMGNILVEISGRMPGSSNKVRVAALKKRLDAWYRETGCANKVASFTETNLIQPGKAPKLRTKAAPARAMVPFVWQMSEEFLNGPSEHDKAVLQLGRHLMGVYSNLHNFDAASLARNSREFADLYVALEAEALRENPESKRWRVKPKLHQMQELCEYVAQVDGNPQNFWCYRDETAGGWMAHAGGRRGGRNSQSANAERALDRFRAFTPFPA